MLWPVLSLSFFIGIDQFIFFKMVPIYYNRILGPWLGKKMRDFENEVAILRGNGVIFQVSSHNFKKADFFLVNFGLFNSRNMATLFSK